MPCRIFTATAISATLLLGSPALAEDVQISGPEIEYLLNGNTAAGTWDGVHYISYFGTDGTTIYASQTGTQQAGKWRVNPDTGQYESFWDAIGWTAYTVLRTESGFAWMYNGKTYPFSVIKGRNLDH